ncbi:MAG: OmpA family protein [Parerythrobacter sp.]
MTNRISSFPLARHATCAGMLAVALVLSGCERDANDPAPEPADTAAIATDANTTPTTVPTNSIFDQEAEVEPVAEILQPLTATIGFEKNGADISAEGLAAIQTVRSSAQFTDGGRITLRGHSDAGGSERVNLRVSRERAEAVRDVLVEAGTSPARIAIIAFGEQNPVEPNALPDGTPNESGRAANRRVELTVGVTNSMSVNSEAGVATPVGEDAAIPR